MIPSFSIGSLLEQAIMALNRNARCPKRANHGARPCSSVMRRLKKSGYYKKPNMKKEEGEEVNPKHLHDD